MKRQSVRIEVEFITVVRGVIGWKNGCKKLVGLGSESKISLGLLTAGLFKWELVSNTV